ncbi:MAG: universal stress protein [Anaerolineales bacterium]|nr:universal stress protein [Anaerolineales bacterium]
MKIILVVDQLPKDEQVIKFGATLAQHTDSTITLLHDSPRQDGRADAEALLSQARQLLPDQSVETSLCFGIPVTKILYEAREGNYDLLVLGADFSAKLPHHGQSISPSTLSIIRRTRASVLVVRDPKPVFSRFLICTGGLDISETAIEAGAQLAKAVQAEVYLLHVAGAIPSMYTGLDEIDETLPELLSTETPIAQHLRRSAEILDRYEVQSHIKLRHGVVTEEIVREVTMSDYDLIISGTPEKTHPIKRLLLGDVIETVIKNTTCPFLIVKKPLSTM